LVFASGLTVIWRWSLCLLWLAENVRSCWTFDDLQCLCLSSYLVKVESIEPFSVFNSRTWACNDIGLLDGVGSDFRELNASENILHGNVFFLFWFCRVLTEKNWQIDAQFWVTVILKLAFTLMPSFLFLVSIHDIHSSLFELPQNALFY